MRGLAALGPRVVRLLLVPQVPAYAALLDKAAASGRSGSVRRCLAWKPSLMSCNHLGSLVCGCNEAALIGTAPLKCRVEADRVRAALLAAFQLSWCACAGIFVCHNNICWAFSRVQATRAKEATPGRFWVQEGH